MRFHEPHIILSTNKLLLIKLYQAYKEANNEINNPCCNHSEVSLFAFSNPAIKMNSLIVFPTTLKVLDIQLTVESELLKYLSVGLQNGEKHGIF